MSSAANWQGHLRRRYGGIINPLPEPDSLSALLSFIPKSKRPGDTYEKNVTLGIEHGVTFDNTRTSYSFNSAKDSVSLPARLRGSSISVISRIPRDMLHALQTLDRTNSDMTGLDSKVEMTARGAEFYRELAMHYAPGPDSTALANIGVVSTIVSGTNLGAGGPIVCDLTRASYSAGIWNLMVGGYVDIVESDGSTVVETDVEVTAVSHANNRITLSKSGVTTDVDATDIILPRGSLALSCVGVQAILENTGSLFEIDAAVYPQWQAISYASGGAMTKAKVLALGARLEENGLKSGGWLKVNAKTFSDLAEEASDLQRFTSNGGTSDVKKLGASALEYKTGCGVIRVETDLIMKQSIGMFIGKGMDGKAVGCRVGSTDNTFEQPGDRNIVHKLEGSAGSQIECYSNQAPLIEIPYHCAIVTGITNTGDTTPSA